jgi:DNA-binding XRE family transcriptional regulator
MAPPHIREPTSLAGPMGVTLKSLRGKWHRAVITVVVASRRESNLTQEQLAAGIGWHRSKIAKIESGERRLDVPEFITISNALNIEPTALLARALRW